jgi:alkanesulfonate monooxygenase SsuD/methylene tetrahydromethanopterin reductase-like flavin-dependent oxidoreductase (luciferase family)
MGIPLSVLDLVMVNAVDGSPRQSMQNSLDLAQHAERCGYKRYGLAGHRNTKGIANRYICFVGFIAAGTTIRVGSGGVMLPNHAPLIIAEQFGTLESLYPGNRPWGWPCSWN